MFLVREGPLGKGCLIKGCLNSTKIPKVGIPKPGIPTVRKDPAVLKTLRAVNHTTAVVVRYHGSNSLPPW